MMNKKSSQSRKVMPLLSGFYFFYYATIGAFLPYWSLYLEKTGFDKAQIGVLMAITMIARVFAPSLWGYLADATGKSMLWIRIATLAELLAWLAIFWLPANFISFFVIMLFFSFFQNAIIPQFEVVTLSWLAKQKNSSVSSYGNIRLWGSIGFIVAVFSLGVLFDYFSLAILPVILAILAFVCFINAWLVAEPNTQSINTHVTVDSKTNNDIQKHIQTKDSFIALLKKPVIAWFFLAQFILLLSHAPFYSFYSNYLAAHDYSNTRIGFLWSVGVLAEVLLFTQSQWILQKYQEKSLVFFCLFITAMRWFLVALAPSLFMLQFFAQCIHAFSFALFQSVAMQLIFREFQSNQQGRAQALYSSCWGLGVAIGSVIVGHFWDATGGAFWFAVAGVMLFLFSLVWWFFCIIKPTV